jgi:hypothetical protein
VLGRSIKIDVSCFLTYVIVDPQTAVFASEMDFCLVGKTGIGLMCTNCFGGMD